MADTFLLTILQHYCITACFFNVDINKTGYDHRNGSFIQKENDINDKCEKPRNKVSANGLNKAEQQRQFTNYVMIEMVFLGTCAWNIG